jgi:hypothetical protein
VLKPLRYQAIATNIIDEVKIVKFCPIIVFKRKRDWAVLLGRGLSQTVFLPWDKYQELGSY